MQRPYFIAIENSAAGVSYALDEVVEHLALNDQGLRERWE